MRIAKCCVAVLFVAFILMTLPQEALFAQQMATVSGVITDAENAEPLAGATIILTTPGRAGIVGGDAADVDGSYDIVQIPPGSYNLTVRYVGYNESVNALTLSAGQNLTLNVELSQGGLDLNTIIISASRQAEKVLDAPASISVIDAAEIEQDVVQSTVSVLRNTTGVDVAQTGVDRSEVVLRGFNNAFGGSAYVLTDYRQAAVPSLNANIHSIMPNMPIDVERIEVVRGPGSALYGPGVDEGVIHYLTKDPFSYPGTTISLTGGERSMIGGQFRHAGVINNDFGYKITAYYSQADDWELDPNDEADAAQLNADAAGIERNYDFSKMNVNGTLQYRINDRTTLTANGGYSQLDAVVLSGIGSLQADGFSNTYGQIRLQSGGFFAQAYVSGNDAGESLVYGSGQRVVDKGVEYNLQAQYDFTLANDRVSMIVGSDYQLTQPDTEGTILGRNELNDDLAEFGGYAQSTIAVSDKLDLTLALRGDWSNIFDFQVSPRAALVFKANPQNTFRTSYNRSFSSPGSNSLFLDIVAGALPVTEDGSLSVLFYGLGSADGATFNNFRNTNEAQLFLPIPRPFDDPRYTGCLPNNYFGCNVNIDAIPINYFYLTAVGGGLPAFLRSPLPLPDALPPLTDQQRGFLANLFERIAGDPTLVQAMNNFTTSEGTTILGIPDAREERGFREVAGPIDIEPLRQTISQTVEVGYKGLINDNVLFALDGYWTNKKDFTGPLLVESPFVYFQQLPLIVDVGTALGQLFATTPALMSNLEELGTTLLSPADVAQIMGALVGGSFDNDFQAGIIQPDEAVIAGALPQGVDGAVAGFLGYRNFGNINYWGIDASLQILASNELTLFGNVSLVSDDLFDNEELDEVNTDLSLALNAPTFKAKMGGSYRMPSGLSINASARHTKGFPVLSGPYVGEVDDYFLMDLGVGFDFQQSVPGLRVDFSVQNLLDNEHREFVGAPNLGRMGLLRMTYTIE